MSISPDQSRFTACVIGEATPEEQSSFDAALLTDAALREEAVTLSRTAHRLTHALKGETPVLLTNEQRHRVLQQGTTRAAAPVRRAGRPAWLGPTFATAGIAAAFALGLYLMPDMKTGTPPAGQETGIPSVAIQPGPASKAGSRPLIPPPSVATGVPASPMPAATSPASPARLERQAAMAATPPVIRVVPAPVPSSDGPEKDFSPAGRALPGKTIPVESLASPKVLPP